MCLKVQWMALVSMVVVALTAAAPAVATTASVADPAGDSASSAGSTTDLTQLDVAWDGGSLRVAATYAQPPPPSSRLDILVSAAARDEHNARVESCDRDMGDSLTVTAAGDQAQLAMPHVEGTLTVKGAADGERRDVCVLVAGADRDVRARHA